MPEDSDALYAAYCGLRRAHSLGEEPAPTGVGRLFCASSEETDEGEGAAAGGTWLGKLSQGLGMMLEVISV